MNENTQTVETEEGDGLEVFRKGLTPKQVGFAEAYAGTARGNATKAATIAGYSEETAKEIGYENLTKLHLRAYITALTKQVHAGELQIRVRLAQIAFDDDYKANALVRVQSLELLAKINGMFKEEPNAGVVVNVHLSGGLLQGNEG